MRFTKSRAVTLAVAALAATGGAMARPVARWFTSVQPYAVTLSAEYDIVPVWSAGDRVPVTDDASRTYQMVGIPDGMGARLNRRGEVVLYLSHELSQTALSEPYVGETRNRGAFVSKLLLDRSGVVLSGKRAYDKVYLDDAYVGPAADESNATPGFARFCAGAQAGSEEGFDTPIYFANEESSGRGTFDGRGGLTVAIFDGEAHGLTWLGRFAWESALVQPGSGDRTVVMSMEDGPSNLDPKQDNSQLWMYVGTKDKTPGATTLARNGLVGGKLYVFRSLDATRRSEASFETGTIEGEWVAVPGAQAMSDVELEAAADAAGAMTFARPEDGVFNRRNARNYFFVTTGGAKGENELGRLYSMRLAKNDPTGHALLSIVYAADAVVAAGGDTALSPDNISCNDDWLMVCEDGTAESRLVMAGKSRDGSIWRFPLLGTLGADPAGERVAELETPGRDGTAVGAGIWETSGILAADDLFGAGSFLFDVQAHRPTAEPVANTVEDGQLLILKKR